MQAKKGLLSVKELQRILSFTRRALSDYDMIKAGDKVAVGISGGKDSMTLLAALAALRRFYPVPYELCAISVDMGFKEMDFSPVARYCDTLGVEYRIAKTDIAEIIFDVRKEKNPCSLCSKMRRGVLHNTAKEMGATRVALGHHFDDAVDTFMLNLFFEGRIGCFSPVSYLSRADLYLIRPLIYAQEKDVRYFVGHSDLPIIQSPCPANHNTEREKMKKLLMSLEKDYDGLRHRIFGAMCRGEIDGFRAVDKLPAFADGEE